MTGIDQINRYEVEICEQLGIAAPERSSEPGSEQSFDPVVLTPKTLARMIDHTLLKATATTEELEKLCLEAKEYGFASVCVNPVNVKLATDLLVGSAVKVCTVIGFPLGANTSRIKAAEAKEAVANGAQEVDMVIDVGALKTQDYNRAFQDILGVVETVRTKALTKVIMETCYLNEEEIVKGCILGQKAGADFVKTSTGFGTKGAIPEEVALMRAVVGPALGVKASGGIRDFSAAELMVKSGATRLGTSSGLEIMRGCRAARNR